MRGVRLFSLILLLSIAAAVFAENPAKPTAESISITIDAAKMGSPINPFIYGQFIEHVGRCIYGGIWAEMLEDRKFFYPVTDDYHPYRDSAKNKFPVVTASPWEVTGPASSVMMVKEDAFVGEHSPQVSASSGIRQNDLGVIAGKQYIGYVWLRAIQDKSHVRISLTWGDGKENRDSVATTIKAGEFMRFPFQFTATKTTDDARLLIEVTKASCIIGAVSLMPDDNVRGLRADTLALLKQLHGTIYRWPGGNFVSGYDWRDGIGARDFRPPRKNPAWPGVEHNDFGIDEFIRLCGEIGAQPMIAVNTGFGDDYSAAQEVEYTNGTPETIGGAWREQAGHEEPFDVKYWCVGNEMFGGWQLGHIPLGQYTQKHNRFVEAMRKIDPELKFVGSGDLSTQDTLNDDKHQGPTGWSEGMIERCGDHMDYISEHFYVGRLPWTNVGKLPIEQHIGLVREEIRKKAAGHRALQAKLGRKPEKFIPIAMDEWNYWHREYQYGDLGCQYTLADALGVAAGLHEYFRNSDIVQAAHYAQTVNVIGCIKTTKTAAFFDTTALPLIIYHRGFGTLPLTVTGNQAERGLDIAAAKTEGGDVITIGIVNPQAEPQTIAVKFKGAILATTATVQRIAGNDPEAVNAPEKQAVKIAEEANVPFGDHITVPAFSVNLYRVPLEK